jgi:cation diffusion facilitator CzcD-associated flavoprotein CzcO
MTSAIHTIEAQTADNNLQRSSARLTMTEIAIIGAGPYGLSVAAHLKRKGIPFRIFGRPMDSWLRHMPKGMLLKSDGFASTVSDPEESFTLKHFCAERGIEYADLGTPVKLETFAAFGLAFKDRFLPELEDKLVTSLEKSSNGFQLQLDSGEVVVARRVVLAVGITHFAFTPPDLAQLPPEFVSHSFAHHDLERFRGRSVVVLGGGSSAIDMAALLAENGANVQLVARAPQLKFHERQAPDKRQPFWEKIRHPKSGLGPGLKSRFCSNWPLAVHFLPQDARLKLVKTHLGPAGGWFAKKMIEGRVPLVLGYSVESAQVKDDKVRLALRGRDGSAREISTDHVIVATGYRVNLERLNFLSDDIRANVKTVENAPALSSSFESSLPGLYFVGVSAANSFGPLMRFAYGATFAARRVTQDVAKALARDPAYVPAASASEVAKYSKVGAHTPR